MMITLMDGVASDNAVVMYIKCLWQSSIDVLEHFTRNQKLVQKWNER